MEKRLFICIVAVCAAFALVLSAQAQTKLKFAHVYEVSEPFHKEAVWAGGEIAKRTNNKYQVDVFAASALGNEQQIAQAMPLGTIDMAYIGAGFVGATYKPLLRKDVDKETSQWCAGCHDPSIMLAGNMTKEIQPLIPESQAGLTCLACHAIDAIHGREGMAATTSPTRSRRPTSATARPRGRSASSPTR